MSMHDKFTKEELEILERIFKDKSPLPPTQNSDIYEQEDAAIMLDELDQAIKAHRIKKAIRLAGLLLTVITILISFAYLMAGHTTLGLLFIMAFAAGHLLQLKAEPDHDLA